MDFLYRLLFDPVEGETSGGGTPTPESAAPVIDSTAGLSRSDLDAPASFRDAGGTDGVVDATPSAPPADPNLNRQPAAETPAQSQAQTIREAAQAYGLDLSRFGDDGAAFAHLVAQAQGNRQADYYAEMGRRVAPH
jgi:hypothetical protein